MKVITPGHTYELNNLEGQPICALGFVQKKQVDGKFETVKDGTTNEEVLAALIDRIQTLNGIAACRENSICLTHLETALLWLEKRTKDRVARNVEGTPAK